MLAYNGLGDVATECESLANLPSSEAALAPSGGYVTTYTHNTAGLMLTRGYAAAGGIQAETLNYGYDLYGQPTSSTRNSSGFGWSYVKAVGYDEFGNPELYTMGTDGSTAYLSSPTTSRRSG
ncbi:hypothetical protein [Actinacidiphila yeochonensis]|uniref:hypothetical protein n=1 Tax=Actinacidiphila yeochonensis TaxID=89050 RepID=UPI000567D056|nr:hypothetical protein [Actinacidiphila yeochonensis]